jgi:hypothetical protein
VSGFGEHSITFWITQLRQACRRRRDRRRGYVL